MEQKQIDEAKSLAWLSYLGLLLLIPLLVLKDNPYAKYHVKQGLVLLIAEIACGVVGRILVFIPVLGWVIGMGLWVCCVVFSIIGIINALNGKAEPLPLIGKYGDAFKI